MNCEASPLARLGPLTVRRFMRDYWQTRPCVIRAAFPRDFATIDSQALTRLAARDDVESRLVTCFGGAWRLRHGPLPPSALPTRRRRDWTLLVQGLDLVDPQIHRLLQRFRFIADARLDDVMASYAVDGGGVGPHVDSYDVFLLQAMGRRRWRIGRQRDTAPIAGAPLRLLADFRPTHEWTLEPGDMLYLPPGVAHEGVAVGECITLSIGFRTPTWAQLAEPWFERIIERLQDVPGYRDAGARPTRTPARLPRALIDRALAALSRGRAARADAEHALLVYLTEPKPHVAFAAATRSVSLPTFGRQLAARGVELDQRTRLLYSGRWFAINGELVPAHATTTRPLRCLADQRCLAGTAVSGGAEAIALLYAWYRSGWLHLMPPRR